MKLFDQTNKISQHNYKLHPINSLGTTLLDLLMFGPDPLASRTLDLDELFRQWIPNTQYFLAHYHPASKASREVANNKAVPVHTLTQTHTHTHTHTHQLTHCQHCYRSVLAKSKSD